jgi:predicted nucleotidyltransferase/DNA-binding XRE family transcriptional regulator
MSETLKEIRKEIGYTQTQAAEYLNVSVRSYKSYENDACKVDTIKYNYMVEKLSNLNFVDETHGILSVELIKNKCTEIFKEYNIEYAYLFGSYAKNKAKENSDVDLLVSSTVKGLKFYGLVEKLSRSLRKKVDLLDTNQLVNNPELLNEILKDGLRIYG